MGTGVEARGAKAAQCVENEEAEGRTKGERRGIFDSEESGITKEKKWKISNMPIYMNCFLCKWLVWAWHVTGTHSECQMDYFN